MDKTGNVDIGISVNVMTVVTGQTLRLKSGKIGTVTENIGDGQWVELRFDDTSEPELVHSQEIDAIL